MLFLQNKVNWRIRVCTDMEFSYNLQTTPT